MLLVKDDLEIVLELGDLFIHVQRTGVRAHADGPVKAEEAVQHSVGNSNAAESTAVGANSPERTFSAERAIDNIHRRSVVLTENPNGSAAHICAGVVAHVVKEPRVQNLKPPTSDEDRASTSSLQSLSLGIAVDKRQVLYRESGRVLVIAMIGRPYLVWIARVLVEDPHSAAAA